MIHIDFSFSNPFIKEKFENLFCRSGSITQNKSWEFQTYYHSYTLFEFGFGLNFKQSHSGLNVAIGIFGYSVDFRIYDNRHWDSENNCWEK